MRQIQRIAISKLSTSTIQLIPLDAISREGAPHILPTVTRSSALTFGQAQQALLQYAMAFTSCAILFTVFLAATARAGLLVTIQASETFTNSGSNAPDMHFRFENWELVATPADAGKTFSVPPALLPYMNAHLTSPTQITVLVNCCGGSSRNFGSPPLLNTGQPIKDPVIINRIAPNLGPNLHGYYLTNVTQTIDALTITPKPGDRTDRHGAFTVSIYGEPVPPLLGDFNVNGNVDAADYALWKNSVEAHDLMPNGVGSGLFEGRAVAEDYDAWRAHFGATVIPSAAGFAYSVPEPAAGLLAAYALGVWAFRRHG